MIAIFDKDKLLNALVPIMYTVSGKNTNSYTEGILIHCGDDNMCTLTSYDFEKGMRTQIECEIQERGKCVINANKLFQIVKTMPKGNIKITVESSYKTVIESENGFSHFDIKSLSASEFPVLPELRAEKGFKIPQYLFRKFVNRILFAIGQNDSRPVFNGAYFEIIKNKMTVVSCDGNRLAHLEYECDFENTNNDKNPLYLLFIVPGKTLVELLKLVKDTEETMEIRVANRQLLFIVGKYILFSKKIESAYIDYERILPKQSNIEFNLNAEELKGALERSALIIEDNLAGTLRPYVKFTIDEVLSISTLSSNGNVYDEIEIEKTKGEDLVIAFNCKFFLDVLKVCDPGKMKLSFVNPLTGVLIEPQNTEEGKFTYFVMPMRMTH
ncbi:MAG: DNA polymerase III subunit beta [Ruminococcaceae bacterium]|nr:DNA polymerase III subunit beta [Oscillospiraceae bacterium]